MATRTVYVGDVEVVYCVSTVDGRPALTELRLRGADVTGDVLRAIKPARLIASEIQGQSVSLCLSRPDGDDPAAFYQRFADAYRSAAATSHSPAVDIAEASGVPADTARFWAKEARRRGHLEPTRARRKRS